MSEPYNPKLFVGRAETLQAIHRWVATYQSHRSRRILGIAGPPGIGKSWVVAQAYTDMHKAGQLVFVLNLSATPLLAVENSSPYPDFIQGPTNLQHPQDYLKWLKTAIKETRKLCSQILPLDVSLAPRSSLEILVEELCAHCSELFPVLIVNGYEELSDKHSHWLQENFFGPFLARVCTLLIITRRDKEWPNISLKLKLSTLVDTYFLEPFSEQDGKAQIQKQFKYQNQVPDPTVLQAVYASIPGYKQTHPKLNSLLMDLAIAKEKEGEPGTLTYQDLKTCIEKIVHPVNISPNAISNLGQMAKSLSTEFSYYEFQKQLQMTLDDLQELFELGILLDGVSKFKIAEGIYELASAMARLTPERSNLERP